MSNTAGFIVMFVVMCAVIGAVVRKCKANNAAVFKAAVERTAAIEVKSNTELAAYNAELVRLQDDYNARVPLMHHPNVALVKLVRKHVPEDAQKPAM